jgi:thiosulfate dehydrogenase
MEKFLQSGWFPLLLLILVAFAVSRETIFAPAGKDYKAIYKQETAHQWQAPDFSSLGNDSLSKQIKYGRDLFANTAIYLGPKGKVAMITNGMNCQNCHLEAGTRFLGNSLSGTAANFPQFRPRSGRVESIEYRVNDCMQRSLNGKPIDSVSREMRSLVAYIKWLGKDVPRGKKPEGAGLAELPVLERAAEPVKGKMVYGLQCQRCHGENGGGQLLNDSSAYTYPPLWGSHSYNISAGLYRISKLAAYIKYNMPFGIASYQQPQLSNEDAWDLAAYIASQPRPEKRFSEDWPDISKKSFDFPFGPYTDGFTEEQHKYGPYAAIIKKPRKK